MRRITFLFFVRRTFLATDLLVFNLGINSKIVDYFLFWSNQCVKPSRHSFNFLLFFIGEGDSF